MKNCIQQQRQRQRQRARRKVIHPSQIRRSKYQASVVIMFLCIPSTNRVASSMLSAKLRYRKNRSSGRKERRMLSSNSTCIFSAQHCPVSCFYRLLSSLGAWKLVTSIPKETFQTKRQGIQSSMYLFLYCGYKKGILLGACGTWRKLLIISLSSTVKTVR